MDSLADLQRRTFETATRATVAGYPPQRRLTAEQLDAYLGRRVYAVVGTARADGRPHTAMSVYERRGTAFWMPTVAGSVREKNLRSQPWMTLVVAEGDDDEHIVVIVEGQGTVVEPESTPDDVRAAVSGSWVSQWIRLDAERVMSFAETGARI